MHHLNMFVFVCAAAIALLCVCTGSHPVETPVLPEDSTDLPKHDNVDQPPVQVGDFAPAEVGTRWEYHNYVFVGYMYSSGINSTYNGTIYITIVGKNIMGSDTVIVLNIEEQSRHIYNLNVSLTDTSTDTVQYKDIAIIRNDSIFAANENRSSIFPFHRSHTVSGSTVLKGFSGADTVFYMNSEGRTYLQRMGFYSPYDSNPSVPTGHWRSIFSTRLVSFNGNPVVFSIKPTETAAAVSTPVSTNGRCTAANANVKDISAAMVHKSSID